MAKEINIEKIKAEIDKGTIEQQYDAFQLIKTHIHSNIEAEQKGAEDRASDLQSKMEKIKQ